MKKTKLSRRTSHRMALLRSLSISLIQHQRIRTTLPKAKALKPFIEKLVTIAKNKSVHTIRLLLSKIGNKDSCKRILETIGPQFKERNGGYTRILRIGQRKGDCAPMVYIEFVSFSQI